MPVEILPTRMGPSAFRYPDPEGAPAADGKRYHAALDWFASGGTVVRSPVTGDVVEIRASRGNSGQIFGGVVKLRQRGSGRVYVLRHVDPDHGLRLGEVVAAGERVATVTTWTDGSDHVHLEVWRTLAGGYRLGNMIDPASLTWTEPTSTTHSGEKLSDANLASSTYLRIVLDGGRIDEAGWREAKPVLLWIAENGLKTERAAIAWRGPTASKVTVWRGSRDVTAVCRSIRAKLIDLS